MSRKKIPLTPQGLQELQGDYDALMSQREHAVKELQIARDMGDRSENAYYKSARSNLSAIDRKIRYLKHTLQYAVVVEKDITRVGIGCIATLDVGGKTKQYELVSPAEADINKERISFHSPLGKVIQGKRIGDSFRYQTPQGMMEGKVIKIG